MTFPAPRPPHAPEQPQLVLSIDPGHTESAYVVYDVGEGRPREFAKVENHILLSNITDWSVCDRLVIEQVACMGMAVGAEVFETVFCSGRFCEAANQRGMAWHRVKRHEVKMHLCGNMRAKDGNIRQALIDRYGPGRELAIGNKKNPGPLYGVSNDVWSALAVAVTWCDRFAPVEAEATR